MRNIDACMAEISRRSEQIIKTRRQRRKHILMACVPAVLCIGLSAALFLPDAAPESVNEAEIANTMPATFIECVTASVFQIEVSGNGGSQIYTDPSEVTRMWDYMKGLTYRYLASSTASSDTDRAESHEELKPESNFSDYSVDDSAVNVTAIVHTITVTMQDGSSTEYTLIGRSLECKETKGTCTLAREQLEELQALLGISRK